MKMKQYLERIMKEYSEIGDSARYGGKHCGSDAEQKGAEYIYRELKKLGLDSVEMIPVETSRYQFNDAVLNAGDLTIYPYGCISPGTPEDGITAEIVNAGVGCRKDYEEIDVSGKIVLIETKEEFEGGALLPAYQIMEAQIRGAAAVVLFRSKDLLNEDTVNASVCTSIPEIPVVSVSRRDAEALIQALPVSANLKVDAEAYCSGGTSYEVIGEIRGETEERILYTGHLDHFFRCLQDNVSSVATCLGIAKLMTESGWKPHRTIDFVFNASHEIGNLEMTPPDLYGAWSLLNTVKPEWSDLIIANINFEYTALSLNKMKIMASYEVAAYAEKFMKVQPDEAEGFGCVDRNVTRDDYYLFTWADTAVAISKGIPVFMNDSVSEQIYEMTSPYCGRDHSNHDDWSICSIDALSTNTRWFERLGRFLDEHPVMELDYTARAQVMALADEEKAALDRWNIHYGEYETALASFGEMAVKLAGWLAEYNEKHSYDSRAAEVGAQLRELQRLVSEATDMLTSDLIGMYDIGHKIYIRKLLALEKNPQMLDMAAVSQNFSDEVAEFFYSSMQKPQTWSEGKIKSVLRSIDVAEEALPSTIDSEREILRELLRLETDALEKAVYMMGRIMFSDEEEYLEWIKGFTAFPHRKTGTPEGAMSAEYVKKTFESLGLENVKIEEADSVCPQVKTCSFSVEGKAYDCFFSNGTGREKYTGSFRTGMDGQAYELVYLGEGNESDFEGVDIEGKIVICDINFLTLHPTDLYDWNEKAEVYDPEGKIKRPLKKYDIYTPNNWPYNYYRAIAGKAAGFAGILNNFMDCHYYHEDYTEITEMFGNEFMTLPAMWISAADGEEIKNLFRQKEHVTCTYMTDIAYESRKAKNVSGVLPGMSDEIILVHSHHDAVCEGAVQDASWMSEVFALAKYFAGIPKEARKKSLMFAATDSHYTDYEGHVAFVEARKNAGDEIILDCVIEHIAKEMDLGENYEIILKDEPETRMLYVRDTNNLLPEMRRLLAKYGLEKTFIFPVYGKSDGAFTQDDVCSDGYVFDAVGIPVVSILAAPMYLFHSTDTLDKVYVRGLRPVGMAFAELITDSFNLF